MVPIFFSFWWLIFPVMGFVFGGFGMWMGHRRSERALDILKTYAAQGKEPPPEVLAAIRGDVTGANGYAGPPVHALGWGGPWAWRAYSLFFSSGRQSSSRPPSFLRRKYVWSSSSRLPNVTSARQSRHFTLVYLNLPWATRLVKSRLSEPQRPQAGTS